jgi:hypothetical protein
MRYIAKCANCRWLSIGVVDHVLKTNVMNVRNKNDFQRVAMKTRLGHELAVPTGTCLLAYRGSVAHGMKVPNTDPNCVDDVDLMGIVLGSPEHYLGLREWGSRGTKEFKQDELDCVFYEIKKIFGLLLQGNPNVMSLLWSRPEDYLILSDAGRRILDARELFVGKHVYNAFAGYAYAQLQKMESRDPADLREYLALTAEAKYRGIHPNHKGEIIAPPAGYVYENEAKNALAMSHDVLLAKLRAYMKKGENLGYLGDKRKGLVLEHGYDTKNAAHCVRLLRMCIEFLNTGELFVFRTYDADELLDIKRGKWTLEAVKELANDLFREAKTCYESSKLPPEPKKHVAEKLLVDILRGHLTTFL